MDRSVERVMSVSGDLSMLMVWSAMLASMEPRDWMWSAGRHFVAIHKTFDGRIFTREIN